MTDMSFRFTGDIAPEDIPARQLISVLSTLDDLVIRASRGLYGSAEKIDYRISSVSSGSIGIEGIVSILAGLQPTFAQFPLVTFQIDSIGQLIKEWLDILKFLEGSPPRIVANVDNGNAVQITNNSGEVTTVNGNVYNTLIINDLGNRTKKLKIPINSGATGLQITENGDNLATYTSAEINNFNNIVTDDLIDNEINAILEIKSPILDGTGSWKFKYGTSTLSAKILDANFLERVDDRQEQFAHGDKFHVRLRTKQFREGDKLRTTHEIMQILNRV